MYILELEHTFSAAHQLKNSYSEKCHSAHGHNWEVLVIIETQELKDDMVVDFTKIKEIIDEFDHKNLNEILLNIEPTAENLAGIIYTKIAKLFTVGNTVEAVIKVTIWEGEKASITYCL